LSVAEGERSNPANELRGGRIERRRQVTLESGQILRRAAPAPQRRVEANPA
jgi:hypothetical protein